MLPWIASQTVTRLRGTATTDLYNNAGIDFANPDRLPIAGCSVQPVVGDEFNQGRDAITTRWNWFGPPDADVTSADRIEHKGAAYEVDGSVQQWDDTTGANLDYRSAVLKRVEG